ncbi:unnamed protein product [Ectocarpus sp. 12 AP-2014]
MEERLPRRPVVRSVVYRRALEEMLPGRAFFTHSCGGREVFGVPAPLENKGEWHETLVSTAPERQPHILQRGSTGGWLLFEGAYGRPACGGLDRVMHTGV